MSADVIVIGAGHNGLVCANYLARAGLKVLVLERRHVVGGAAVTEEIAPGFRASIFSYLMSLLHPRIIRDFDLKRHGLTVLPCSDMVSPVGDGTDYIVFSDNIPRTQTSFRRFSEKDAAIYPEFDKYLMESAAIVRRLLWETPVDPTRRNWRTFKDAAQLLWKYRRVGRKMYRIADLMTMSAYDFLHEWFEDDRIMAVLAYYASIGTFAGPKTPGSAYVIMHHVMGEHEGAGGWGFVRGGMGAITQALAAAAREQGVEIRTDAEIREVRTGGDGLTVVTDRGERFAARTIAANLNAKVLYRTLLDPAAVPPEVKREIDNYRTFSTAFKMNIACERPPQYKILDRVRAEGAIGNFPYPTYMHIAPDIEYLERAYDDAKYGWYSKRPFITPVVPTIVDDTLAPPGKHVVNLFGGHAPTTLKGATWDDERENFKATVFDTIEEFAPGFRDDVIEAQLLVAPDIERIVGLPDGHIFHGELSTDQLFFQRPVSGYADYRTPVKGLYVCGASMHPGGGVSGIPGANAAREILKDLRLRPARRAA